VKYDIHAGNQVFRELFDNSPHPLWVFDLKSLRFLAVNDSVVQKYGYSREELLAMKVTDIRPSEEVSRFIKHLHTQTSLVDKAGRWIHRKKDASLIYVDITAQKITFNGHDAEMVLAVDVTGQVQALKALEEAEHKYRGLVEQSLAGIYIMKDMRITYANPHLAAMFGYTTEEVYKLDFLTIVDTADRDHVLEMIQQRLTGAAPTGHGTYKGRRKDGSEIIVDIHGAKLDDGMGYSITGVVLDVTEAKRAEQRNLEHVAELERMLRHTIGAITTMGDIRDSYTAGHEKRVGDLAAAIGSEMGIDLESQEWLRTAGMVHDSGKIGIPTDILTKPKRLTIHEYELVKTHSQLGFEILKSIAFPRPLAQVVLQHHERLDGSGYPENLKDAEILRDAKILAVADVVESMASHRPYRAALGLEKALNEISGKAGVLYDSLAVDACVRLFKQRGYELGG
jgi:PAS domain S-box-containing protein